MPKWRDLLFEREEQVFWHRARANQHALQAAQVVFGPVGVVEQVHEDDGRCLDGGALFGLDGFEEGERVGHERGEDTLAGVDERMHAADDQAEHVEDWYRAGDCFVRVQHATVALLQVRRVDEIEVGEHGAFESYRLS